MVVIPYIFFKSSSFTIINNLIDHFLNLRILFSFNLSFNIVDALQLNCSDDSHYSLKVFSFFYYFFMQSKIFFFQVFKRATHFYILYLYIFLNKKIFNKLDTQYYPHLIKIINKLILFTKPYLVLFI